MTRPLVSVVISTYNYGRYIAQTLESVLGQEFPPSEFEVLLFDDASTDDTSERVRPFLGRIRYVRQDVNIGLVPTLNRAFAAARGKYVCPLDADDIWTPAKLKEVVERFENEPDLGGMTHGARIVDADGRETGIEQPRPSPSRSRYTLEDLLAGPTHPGHLSCVSFRKDVLDEILPLPGDRRMVVPDNYMFNHALFFAPAGVIHKSLALYRAHGDNWSNRMGAMKANIRELRMARYSERILDAGLKRRLRRTGRVLSWPKDELARRRNERLERLTLLTAYQGKRRLAFRLRSAFVPTVPAGQRPLKWAALELAILCPSFYRRAFLFYRALRLRTPIARLGY